MPVHSRLIGITGGSGYIGSALAEHLSRSFRVRLLDVVEPNSGLGGKTEFRRCDVTRRSDVESGLEGVELLIHTSIIQIPRINTDKKLGYEVNVIGTQNVCSVVDGSPSARGMILAGTWHTIGEMGLSGKIDEESGFRPDKVEERARLYAISKVAQESIVRMFGQISQKRYGVMKMGTVLGPRMPKETAASTFIERAMRGEALTPHKDSMHRPIFYVDLGDVCTAFERLSLLFLDEHSKKVQGSSPAVINACYPKPVNVLDLAQFVSDAFVRHSKGKIRPQITLVDRGVPSLFKANDKEKVEMNLARAAELLGLRSFKSPRESIDSLVLNRLHS